MNDDDENEVADSGPREREYSIVDIHPELSAFKNALRNCDTQLAHESSQHSVISQGGQNEVRDTEKKNVDHILPDTASDTSEKPPFPIRLIEGNIYIIAAVSMTFFFS